MENRSWEDDLKNKLEDFRPEGLQPDWDFFATYLSVHEQISALEEDEVFDESLKESVSTYEAPPKTEGWDRLDATLNKADQQFDEHIRNKINHFEPKYNPRTWPLLLQSLSGAAFLRAKLIAFKVVEVAAVFLLLFTVFKMGQMGKLPFETPLFTNSKETLNNSSNIVTAENLSAGSEANIQHDKSSAEVSDVSNNTASLLPLNSASSSDLKDSSASLINEGESDVVDYAVVNAVRNGKSVDPIAFDLLPIQAKKKLIPDHHAEIAMVTPGEDESGNDGKKGLAAVTSMFNKLAVANFLSTALSPIKWNHHNVLPKPHYIKQRSKAFTEFGIVSQVDYNLLRMPEDRLFNSGRQIIFPQKGIPSANLGGGFSFALVQPKWALETGMVYSPKNFKPGRHIVVGDSFDQGSIEFQAMRLQLVSVPLNLRYRFDNKGAFKYYGIAGCGLHIIAQSNIDLMIEYQFLSLSFNEDPTKDPQTASVIRDTKHISEHIRDGAPFSTKSFFSINAGAGIEYSISENKTLFLQSAVQYQVPNLRFSNINGKHIRSVSLQAGVRTPLGK